MPTANYGCGSIHDLRGSAGPSRYRHGAGLGDCGKEVRGGLGRGFFGAAAPAAAAQSRL